MLERIRAYDRRADDVLAKPFSIDPPSS